MRGKRIFKKAISRMGSGRWRWNVLDAYGDHVASGFSMSNAEARKESMDAERAAMKEVESVKGNTLKTGSGGWRAAKSGHRLFVTRCICNRA